MDLKLQQAIRDFGEIVDDTTDAYIAYFQEKDPERKKTARIIYKKLDKKRAEAIKRMNHLVQKAYGK